MSRLNLTSTLMAIIPVICLSCHGQIQDKWNPGMEIKIYHGGGMVPESQTVILNGSTNMYIHWLQRKTDTFYFKLSQTELDDLLAVVNKNKFNAMVSGETGYVAYDKPTTSIELKTGTKIHEVNVGATTGIKKGNAENFFGLYNHILALALMKTGQAAN